MGATTTYDVNVNYNVRDKGSRGLQNIERGARRAANATSSLDMMARRLMAAGGAFLGVRKAKEWLVDYNAELEQSKIAMSGLLQLNMGGEFAKNQERANALINKFREDAKKSTATTKDFVDFAQMITGPLTRAGASMKQLTELTRSGVVASRAMGIESGMAALDIEQAVAGTLKARDRFARAIIEPYLKSKGVQKDFTETWNEFVRKDPAGAVEELNKALNQPAILQMAKAQEKSWAGMTSTLKDNLQRALGKVGLPLMKAMSAEIEKLNAWFSKNPDRVNEIVNSMSDSIVSAFHTAKKIMQFIVDNRGLLMTIAKAYLVGKIAGGLGGAIARPFEMISGTLKNTNTSFLGFERGLKGVVSGLGTAMGVIGVAAVGFQALADRALAKQEKRIKRQTETSFAVEHAQALAGMEGAKQDKARRWAMGRARRKGTLGITGLKYGTDVELAKDVLTSARGAGMITGKVGEGRVDIRRSLARYGAGIDNKLLFAKNAAEMRTILESRKSGIKGGTKEERWALKTIEGLERALVYDRELKRRQDAANWDKFLAKFEETLKDGNLWTAMLAAAGVPVGAAGTPKGKKWTTNVNAKVEIKKVVSDDPDRFALDLIGTMENIARNGVQARRTLREGAG